MTFVKKMALTGLLVTSGLAVSPATYAIEAFEALQNSHWLVSGKRKGLTVYDQRMQIVANKSGHYQQLDSRDIAQKKQLVAAVNGGTNTLELYQWDNSSLTLLDSHPVTGDELTGVCLYKDDRQQLIYAFLMHSRRMVEQRLVFDLSSQHVMNKKVRDLPLSFDVSACDASDATNTVFIAEEKIGVWKFDANPEGVLSKEPVAMVQPFGQLQSEIKGLTALNDGTLLISQPETKQIAIAQPHRKTKLLPFFRDIESVSGEWRSDKTLTLFGMRKRGKLKQKDISMSALMVQQPTSITSVYPAVETMPVEQFGDAADDPAIWFNSQTPEKSLVLGTDKKAGLGVYDLQGDLMQFLPVGRLNNVDVKSDVIYQGKSIALAAASHRDHNSIALFAIDQNTQQVTELPEINTTLADVYGLCMYQPASLSALYVFINDKDGRYQQYQLKTDKTVNGKLVREFTVKDQPEGCVANDQTGDLFVGVEDHGVWHMSAEPGSKHMTKIIGINDVVHDDVEGMSLYQAGEESLLVVSSQGNNSYAFFNARAPFDYLGSLTVDADVAKGIDGSSETDGLAVSSANFGGAFSKGMLVVQDGRNVMPVEPQNFKFVSFEEIFLKADFLKSFSQ